ncbi:SRPBCC family protein [Luteipulveratus mongoliensis]|uniref:Polyketide cyclase n=1 Tax=Luteipulveratus mongoliensis TaxID=571913 RepID=A0A0K1JQ57_9MICO|nr:SRPBCC family protein [Luteipulveratus mongoliensis]AKU18854.1 hypothetical protein VV02_11860 [Luteipulveratus mongoliensis]
MSSSVVAQQSRAIPIPVDEAFARTLVLPLPDLFSRRYGPVPRIKEVRDQDGEWARAGQTRTIALADGGSMVEELMTVDPPHRFTYVLTQVKGPLAPLSQRIEGEWAFVPTGTGTEVTWSWTMAPRTPVSRAGLIVFARLWKGYARHALEVLSHELVR